MKAKTHYLAPDELNALRAQCVSPYTGPCVSVDAGDLLSMLDQVGDLQRELSAVHRFLDLAAEELAIYNALPESERTEIRCRAHGQRVLAHVEDLVAQRHRR